MNQAAENEKKRIIKKRVLIDAGVENIHVKIYSNPDSDIETVSHDSVIINNDEISKLFHSSGFYDELAAYENDSGGTEIYITGKVAGITQKVLGRGEIIIPSAALWSAAKNCFLKEENKNINTIAIMDLSASGYMLICIDKNEKLVDDTLVVNPRCGAGTGVNLSRILQKLDIDRNDVDKILHDYLGTGGKDIRNSIHVRSDRCGVFSSSATISDKNQGIPLEHALAVTMKSEAMKPCSRIPSGIDRVYLTGGVFRWQYMRDCAEDFLIERGAKEVIYDSSQSMLTDGMYHLVKGTGGGFRKQAKDKLRRENKLIELPPFRNLKEKYESSGLYRRIPDEEIKTPSSGDFSDIPVNIAMDIGSTMAKMIVTDAATDRILFKNSYDNHGDTIQTIKYIFSDFIKGNIPKLKIQNIGLTGSGRYQVQKALGEIYPHLSGRIFVLVENYAHARGAIQYAKDHINKLKAGGISEVNENFCVLVDIGGEDTKVTIISLEREELFDNAMNVKCSAGTGSLMDTLKALFGIDDIREAYAGAYGAEKVYSINATCAVFLMENARKMQADGYSKDEIFASCTYSIVENMARTLWDQVDIPGNTVVLLHGQTMLSDPLPLAVTHRIQEYSGSDTYCLVPPFPGHRACIGLISSIDSRNNETTDRYCDLGSFVNQAFEKKIFTCHGVACGDKNARCSRTLLTGTGEIQKIQLKLGGCTAVNELEAGRCKGKRKDVPDAYRDLWKFHDSHMPRSEAENRLVIPRSFSMSEQAYFMGKIFEKTGIPVYVDNVIERDIINAQPLFPIDTCAPNIGTTGQFIRLARVEKGIILIPQLDFIPSGGTGLGRTCTTNQGGTLIAMHFAQERYPDAKFMIFNLSMDRDDPEYIGSQMHKELGPLFEFYGKNISKHEFIQAVKSAQEENIRLKNAIADKTADYIEYAIDNKINISIVTGRDYILNPGIYDSHMGKLLREKGVLAIPSYAVEVYANSRFGYMYWRNPHDILSKVNAITRKEFHLIIKNQRLKNLVKKIETGLTGSLLSVVTISTFRCGPDTVMLPMLNELTKDFPSLLIQSDAMIAELAHLENRVNTHLNQLEKKLHDEIKAGDAGNFDIEMLNEFNLDSLNTKTDVVYFPTMDDNRIITAVFRTIGVTVIDNFDDDSYDLHEKAANGRKYVGDMVCVPLSAVYTDMLRAIEDFIRRKKEDDPAVRGKERLILFMHGGDGPCRLGQYVDMYKLAFYRLFGRPAPDPADRYKDRPALKLLTNVSSSLLGKDDYSAQMEKWAGYLAYEGVIAHGVFHSAYMLAASLCHDLNEFKEMRQDYISLKEEIYYIIENRARPGKIKKSMVIATGKLVPKLTGVAEYLGYGLYNSNGFRKVLRKFSNKWITPRLKNSDLSGRIKIHIDGELYMRCAQVEDILKSVIDTLGFGTFIMNYSPMWSFFENILEGRIIVANKDIHTFNEAIKNSTDFSEREKFSKLIRGREQIIIKTDKTIGNFRNILAKPLYNAAGIDMPHKMKTVFAAAQPVIPTFKPFGELVPYVGETILNLRDGVDLVLNVFPEGCMVSSMGQTLSPKIMQESGKSNARIQNLSSNEGELAEDILQLALLRIMGPERFYSADN